MFHYSHSNQGQQLCLDTSWAKGHNRNFANKDHFELQARRMVSEVGCDEITIYDSDSWEPVAYLALQLCASFHSSGYGLNVLVSAVRQDLEGDFKLAKFIMKTVKELALKEDCSWYEYSKHVSPSITQTITKEI